MKNVLICGRTRPTRGLAERKNLREIVDRLLKAAPRLKSLLGPPPASGRANDDFFYLEHLARPLPVVTLPDGTQPILVNQAMSDDCRSGIRQLNSLSDPLLQELWSACMEEKVLRAGVNLAITPPNLVKWAALSFDLMRRETGQITTLDFTYYPLEESPNASRVIAEACGLVGATPAEQLEPSSKLGMTRHVLPRDLPASLEILAQVLEGVNKLGWSAEPVAGRPRFLVAEWTNQFMKIRGRLNEVTGGWYSDVPGWYQAGFDPFISVPAPPEGEEYRYPVAFYKKRNRPTETQPSLQVDVVHLTEGSFLEFQSAEAPKYVLGTAEAVGLELEMWQGAAADRWR